MVKTTIISDDLKNMVISSVSNNPTIEPLDMNLHKRFCIGTVSITVLPDGSIMSYLPDDFTTQHNALWRTDVGGVLVKELRKKDVLLYEHKSANFKVLLKKIREEEIEDFNSRGLNHLTVGETSYCIIKAVKATDVMYVNNVKNEKYIVDVDEEETSPVHYIEEDSQQNDSQDCVQYSLF